MTDLRIEAWKPKKQFGGRVSVRGWLLALLVAASLFSNAWQYAHRVVVLQISFGSARTRERPPAQNPPIHTQLKRAAIKLAPSPAPALTLFDSMNEAAIYALESAYHDSHYYEVGGVITKVGDKFAIGAPRTDWSGDSVEIDDDPIDYHGTIVASYHTHPCNSTSHVPRLFSPNDLRSDRSLGKPGYMANLCTGIVTKYDPVTDHLPDVSRFMGWQGPTVGQFHVDGIALDADADELE